MNIGWRILTMKISSITHNQFAAGNSAAQMPARNPAGETGDSGKAEAQAVQNPASRVSFSDRVKSSAEDETQEMAADKETLLQQMDSANQAGDALAQTFDVIRKCLLIATRIRNGDHVPDKDTRFLLENNPELYVQALMLRQQNENARQHESVLEEETKSQDVSANSRNHSVAIESTGESAAPSSSQTVEQPAVGNA